MTVRAQAAILPMQFFFVSHKSLIVVRLFLLLNFESLILERSCSFIYFLPKNTEHNDTAVVNMRLVTAFFIRHDDHASIWNGKQADFPSLESLCSLVPRDCHLDLSLQRKFSFGVVTCRLDGRKQSTPRLLRMLPLSVILRTWNKSR